MPPGWRHRQQVYRSTGGGISGTRPHSWHWPEKPSSPSIRPRKARSSSHTPNTTATAKIAAAHAPMATPCIVQGLVCGHACGVDDAPTPHVFLLSMSMADLLFTSGGAHPGAAPVEHQLPSVPGEKPGRGLRTQESRVTPTPLPGSCEGG